MIIINCEEVDFQKDRISYDELATLAHGERHRPGRVWSAVFHRGPMEKPDGILAPGQEVAVKPGMVFTIVDTSSA